MKRLMKYIRPYVGFIILTMFIKLLGAGLELLIPYLMEIILDDIVPAREQGKIFLYGGLMLLCAVGCLGGNVLANRMSARSAGRITLKIRHDLFEQLENLSARQMDKLTVSSAESRLTSDTYNINQLLARVQRLGIRAPILLIGGIAMTLTMDAPLVLDDALVRFDDDRLAAAMEVLRSEADKKQVILFTCQSREKNLEA